MKTLANALKWRFDIYERYKPCIERLTRSDVLTILEVGAGNYGLEYFGFRNVRSTDIVGEREYLDITQLLPADFPQYDAVVAIDVLEHISPAKRSFAVEQMCKVAKKLVIIAVPFGPVAFEFDQELYDHLVSKNYGRKHLSEHIEHGVFDISGLIQDLENPRLDKVGMFNGINIGAHRRIALFLFSKSGVLFLLKNKLLYPIRDLIISRNQSDTPYRIYIEVLLASTPTFSQAREGGLFFLRWFWSGQNPRCVLHNTSEVLSPSTSYHPLFRNFFPMLLPPL